MSLRKYASLAVLETWQEPRGRPGMRKSAHRVAFDYEPRPGYLYVRSRMISSRTNDNHDTFPPEEIAKGYRTFLGKPVFVNHHNANHRRARGVIVAVALHRDRNPDGSPDTWAEGLMEVDALRFPKLASAILAGKVNRTSMGVDVEWSRCSACGNKATNPAEYCAHLPSLKGKKIRKTNPRTGRVEERLIHEICAGLSFFENSLLVEDPADPTAYVLGSVDDRGLKMTAGKNAAGDEYVSGYGSDPRFEGVSLRKDAKGYYVATHRARSDSYPSPDKIPDSKVEFIRSTGARREPPVSYSPELDFDRPMRRRAAGPRYPDPAEHPFYQANPVHADNVVRAYHETTPDEKALGKRWYPDAHHVAKAIAGGNAALGAGLLSAYSPRTAWPVNMFNASRAAQGDPPGPGSGAMGMHQKPALRMLAGEHHSKVLKAPKTAAFAHLIEHGGDSDDDSKNGTEKVVVDRHAMSVAMGRRISDDDDAPLGHPHYYNHAAQTYRDAAHRLSEHYGRKIAPHEVQAATWLGQIRKNQAEDSAHAFGGKGRVNMQQNARERWRQHHPQAHPGGIGEENMHYHGRRAVAYGEERVPPQVDTLRMEECPVCGEHDVWSGDRCPVCGFTVPPSLFRDPDTGKAQQVRDQLDQAGEVMTGPDGQPMGSDPDADAQLQHPDQLTPDGVPVAQGPAGAPAAQVPGQEEQLAGQEEQEQGEEDQFAGQDEQGEGQELENQGTEDELAPAPPGQLACPACGQTFAPDVAAQPGVPCPACRQGSLEPAGGPQKEQEDPSLEEEDDDDMAGSKTAAALAQAQAHRIAVLTAENDVLREQLGFLANAAGAGQHLAAIRQRVMQRHADVLNPASPVPDPPEAPPSETTEMALAPDAMDDPSRPGTTPGSTEAVPAAQTTTAITPGVEMQTPPATNLVDVTAPVQGTNPSQDGGVPLEQRRIETDVRIDPDPLKAHGPGIGGQGDNGAAFPWLMEGQQQGQRKAASLAPADASAARTFGSIRLAKLRIQAGLAQGDELAVAAAIEKDARLPDAVIEHEIGVLSRVRAPQAAPRQMTRQATRSAPSLASVGSAHYASAASAAGAGPDDSDLFID